jgi:hypothetical protein
MDLQNLSIVVPLFEAINSNEILHIMLISGVEEGIELVELVPLQCLMMEHEQNKRIGNDLVLRDGMYHP